MKNIIIGIKRKSKRMLKIEETDDSMKEKALWGRQEAFLR